MTTLKIKELAKMSKEEKEKKLKELKLELVKTKTNASKGGPNKMEIKKIIARIMTLNTKENSEVLNKK